MAVKHTGQHKHQIGKTVEVLARGVFERLFIAQGHQCALGPARHSAAHMGLRGATAACGQNEFFEFGQGRVVLGQCLVQRQHGLGLEQLVAGDGQLAAQVEKLVLNLQQDRTYLVGHGLAQQHANVGVEFVHVTHGVYAQAVFGNAGVIPQAGGAVVSGAGGNLCEAVSHGTVLGSKCDY